MEGDKWTRHKGEERGGMAFSHVDLCFAAGQVACVVERAEGGGVICNIKVILEEIADSGSTSSAPLHRRTYVIRSLVIIKITQILRKCPPRSQPLPRELPPHQLLPFLPPRRTVHTGGTVFPDRLPLLHYVPAQ